MCPMPVRPSLDSLERVDLPLLQRVPNPPRMSSSKQVTLRWTGQGDVFKGRSGSGPELTIDGDSQAGPSCTETLLMALMGCMAIDVLMILQKGRVEVGSLEVCADSDRNPDPPRYFKRICLTFVFGGVAAEARPKVDRATELSSEKYCSVLHSLRQDLEFETVVDGV